MNEFFQFLLYNEFVRGVLVTLGVVIITHYLTSRRERTKFDREVLLKRVDWMRDDLKHAREANAQLEAKHDKLEAERQKLLTENREKREHADELIRGTLVLLQQRRDVLTGLSQDEQQRRADALMGQLREKTSDELEEMLRQAEEHLK